MQDVPLLDNFLANLKSACDERSISQAELARRSGVHYVTISRIFSGKHEPSVPICERLATAAGLRADLIFVTPQQQPS